MVGQNPGRRYLGYSWTAGARKHGIRRALVPAGHSPREGIDGLEILAVNGLKFKFCPGLF